MSLSFSLAPFDLKKKGLFKSILISHLLDLLKSTKILANHFIDGFHSCISAKSAGKMADFETLILCISLNQVKCVPIFVRI